MDFSLATDFIDLDREASLLTRLVADEEAYWSTVNALSPEVFAAPDHRDAYTRLARAYSAKQPAPDFTPAGSVSRLDEPLKTAAELTDLYQRRLLAKVLGEAGKSLYSAAHGEAMEVTRQLWSRLAGIEGVVVDSQVGQARGYLDLVGPLCTSLRRKQELVKQHGLAGLYTGLSSLDKALGGLQQGVHVLAAEPGTGKTAMAIHLAVESTSRGIPAVIVSFEDSADDITLKAVCSRAGLVAKDYRDGVGDLEKLVGAITEWQPSLVPLHVIEGSSKLTTAHLHAALVKAMGQFQSDRALLIVDYVQKWAAVRDSKKDFRLVVGEVLANLREIAQRLHVPCVAISSINREAYDGKAGLKALKESGDLEYNADSVLFLAHNSKSSLGYPGRHVVCNLLKNRFGEANLQLDLCFMPAQGRWGMLDATR